MENQAVTNFREYLRIPTVHPNVDYSKCVSFIQRLANEIGLRCSVVGKPDKPVIILTWEGKDKSTGSIMLNSHMDTVPVSKEDWSHEPFEAVKDANGNIFGRGAQDTKSTGIQHIEAVRRLKNKGVSLKRTVHITFVPDEEIGGEDGMGYFVQSEDFKKLNISFAVDEGSPRLDNIYAVFNEERTAEKIKIRCNGPTGHGSLLHPNTAGEKFHKVLDAFMDFRETQLIKLKNASEEVEELTKLAEVTSINLTEVEGGKQNNVVPPELVLGFDVRLSVHEDHEKFYAWVESVCKDAGEGVYCESLMRYPKAPKTPLDSSNPFWIAFKGVMDNMKITVKVIPCFGTSDARYLRRAGVPTINFAPMRNTPMLFHANDEMLNESVFLEGIDVYANLIEAMANV